MSSKPKIVGKKWTIACAVLGALAGLIVTASDDLFDLPRLGPELRFPYQLLGALGGGYLGTAIGKLMDRKKQE